MLSSAYLCFNRGTGLEARGGGGGGYIGGEGLGGLQL